MVRSLEKSARTVPLRVFNICCRSLKYWPFSSSQEASAPCGLLTPLPERCLFTKPFGFSHCPVLKIQDPLQAPGSWIHPTPSINTSLFLRATSNAGGALRETWSLEACGLLALCPAMFFLPCLSRFGSVYTFLTSQKPLLLLPLSLPPESLPWIPSVHVSRAFFLLLWLLLSRLLFPFR